MPTVSIVMAAFNHADFIAQAIASALAQTMQDIELLVVDDGSTDHTTETVRPFLADPRVRFFRKNNGGQASAKNHGIAQATGQFIAFLDADDVWKPRKLELQLPLFDNPRVGVVHCWREIIDQHGQQKPYSQKKLPRGNVLNEAFIDNFVCFSSSIVRRTCFERLGIFDQNLRLGIDYELWMRFAVDYEFDHVEEPLVCYRTGHEQLSKSAEERINTALLIMERGMNTPRIRSRLSDCAIREAYALTHNSAAYLHLRHGRMGQARKQAVASLLHNPAQALAYKIILRSWAPAPALWVLNKWRDLLSGRQDV